MAIMETKTEKFAVMNFGSFFCFTFRNIFREHGIFYRLLFREKRGCSHSGIFFSMVYNTCQNVGRVNYPSEKNQNELQYCTVFIYNQCKFTIKERNVISIYTKVLILTYLPNIVHSIKTLSASSWIQHTILFAIFTLRSVDRS